MGQGTRRGGKEKGRREERVKGRGVRGRVRKERRKRGGEEGRMRKG